MEAKRILLVDDHPNVIYAYTSMLDCLESKYSYIVHTATTAEEGVDLVRNNDYDLAVMDCNFNKMQGDEATREIKKIKPKLPVLGLTGILEYPSIVLMKEAGACGFISKKITPQDFIKCVEQSIEGNEYYTQDVIELEKCFYSIGNTGHLIPETQMYLIDREKEILLLQLAYYKNDEIAEKLNISKETVRRHQENAMPKFKAHSHAELLRKAKEYFQQEGIL